MKVGPLTRISSPAPEICPNVLLAGDAERVFLYYQDSTEHTAYL